MKRLVFIFFILFFATNIFSNVRQGADKGAPYIAEYLKQLNIEKKSNYVFLQNECLDLINIASNYGLNVFELIDCVYRYISLFGYRVVIKGEYLIEAKKLYDFGGVRVESLLPIDKIIKIECGAIFKKGQRALDFYIKETYEEYIEIATAMYEKQFGFAKLSPNLFEESYGMRIKKFFFVSPLVKIEIYEPCKAAIYAKNFPIPKRWVLKNIKKL